MTARPFIILAFSALILSACGTPGTGSAQFDQAGTSGSGSVVQTEAAWRRNPDSPQAATAYAHALSEAGRDNRAAIILAPLAEGKGKNNAALHTQLSLIRSNLNAYGEAADEARTASELDPTSSTAQFALGIALDGQNKYPEAEKAYRKALALDNGDRSEILNNLGLNLASQGFVSDAISTLEEASKLSPGNRDLERNIRIVSALKAQPKPFGWKNIPPPPHKPSAPEMAKTSGKMDQAATSPIEEKAERKNEPEDMMSSQKQKEAKNTDTKIPAKPAAIPVNN